MIINDDTHDYTCTDCRHTGRPCMEAIWLCQKLTQSMSDSPPSPRREMTSSARFRGCGFACDATVRVNCDDVQIFCGVEDSGIDKASLPAAARLPRALVLAAPVSREAETEARRA